MRRTSIGLLLPTRELVMGDASADFAPILDLSRQAEELGLDAVWVGDSLLARPRFEPVTTLSAVAAVTSRVTLGTAILLAGLRHPVPLATELATLELLSGSRLIVGIGSGARNPGNRRDFEACGVPFGERARVLDESVELMRRLWTEEEVTFEGEYFHLDGARPGLRPRRAIPLWFAGGAEPALRRIVARGDGWLTLAPTPERFASEWAMLQELSAEAGRDAAGLHRAVYVTLNIDEDRGRAEQQLRAFFEGYYHASFDDLRHQHAFIGGSAEECAAWLRAFLDAGADTLIVRFSRTDQREQLERFGNEVQPLLS